MATMKVLEYGENYRYQGPRYVRLGPDSGEEFRDKYFLPWLKNHHGESLEVDFTGTVVYTPSFLEECFGGSIRMGYTEVKKIKFLNMPDDELSRLEKFIRDAKPNG